MPAGCGKRTFDDLGTDAPGSQSTDESISIGQPKRPTAAAALPAAALVLGVLPLPAALLGLSTQLRPFARPSENRPACGQLFRFVAFSHDILRRSVAR
eukprot:SAG22_NODE_4349_length_1294_cov_13.632636_1_plen_98_part_00